MTGNDLQRVMKDPEIRIEPYRKMMAGILARAHEELYSDDVMVALGSLLWWLLCDEPYEYLDYLGFPSDRDDVFIRLFEHPTEKTSRSVTSFHPRELGLGSKYTDKHIFIDVLSRELPAFLERTANEARSKSSGDPRRDKTDQDDGRRDGERRSEPARRLPRAS